MARPFLAPPGVPPERKQALRAAFDETMRDPAFLAEAKQHGLEVNPVSGADSDKLIEELYQTPADIIAEVRDSIAPGAK
jgi:tripartite-type tricarboxylate transporter receptor subunit TctC